MKKLGVRVLERLHLLGVGPLVGRAGVYKTVNHL
jgi:hypothetical protein